MANSNEGTGCIVLLLVLGVGAYYGYQRLKESWDGQSQRIDAPKRIVADGVQYVACEGSILIYSPSRDVVASGGTKKSYEIVFTDDFGQQEDLKGLTSYEVYKAPDAQYAMGPHATESNASTTYSDGTPMTVGAVVTFGQDSKGGRARWNGVGKWAPVPCSAR
jgi:hypothetical protein